MIAVSDGPRHTAVRRLLAPSLGPRALRRLAVQVSATTRRLLSEAVDRGECDFARDVAAVIPLATICDLLDVPDADRPFLREQASLALGSEEPTQSAAEVWLARNEILLYFRELARARRATPGEDLVSVLASGQVDGEPISEDEVILNCYSLILGGDETTRLSMSGAVAAFAVGPDEWSRFRAGLVVLDSAVEEVLRWTTPGMHAGRTAAHDVVLHGGRVAAGEIVTVWNVAANRDEREFSEPDRFDLARSPNRHVSFGYGPHFCLGASLARVEISALLEALRTLASSIDVNGEPRRIFSNFLAGFSALPVVLAPAAPPGTPSGTRR
jgi:cytochrome P450